MAPRRRLPHSSQLALTIAIVGEQSTLSGFEIAKGSQAWWQIKPEVTLKSVPLPAAVAATIAQRQAGYRLLATMD